MINMSFRNLASELIQFPIAGSFGQVYAFVPQCILLAFIVDLIDSTQQCQHCKTRALRCFTTLVKLQ